MEDLEMVEFGKCLHLRKKWPHRLRMLLASDIVVD